MFKLDKKQTKMHGVKSSKNIKGIYISVGTEALSKAQYQNGSDEEKMCSAINTPSGV